MNPVSLGNSHLALSLPVGSVSLFHLFHWTFGWSPPICCFPSSAKAAAFPRPEKIHLTRHARGRPGREPSWLWDIATYPHKQTQSSASLPASQRFHFFSCFHHLYVKQWLRRKRKIKHRERKQKKPKKTPPSKKRSLCQKYLLMSLIIGRKSKVLIN